MSSSHLLDRYADVDSAAVSDALDQLGLPPGVGGLGPVCGPASIVGFAVTVGLEPADGGPDGAHVITTAVDAAGDTDIVVVANQGRTDVSCWGGILSLGASLRGVRGAVADGVCRDVAEARELGFPVFALGSVPATARGRLRQSSTGAPVTVAGLTVHQGDVVLADETGLVVVPRSHAEQVAVLAAAIVARERSIAEEVRAGAVLSQAMHDARLAGEVAR